MRLVIDTNVLISGYGWDGPPRQLIDRATNNQVTLYASDLTLAEFAGVISREHLRPQWMRRGQTSEGIYADYDLLTYKVKVGIVEAISRDPKDDKFLATALAANADVLVSGDDDLKVLNPWRGIEILSPSETLERIDSGNDINFVSEPAPSYAVHKLPLAA